MKRIASLRTIPPQLEKVIELIPSDALGMEVMRTVCSYLGCIEFECPKVPRGPIDVVIRMVALFGPCLLYWHHFHESGIRIDAYTGAEDSVALNFMKLLTRKGKIDPLIVRTVDVSLILYAEHDFNASTFAARITTSTNADIYAAITSAIGTLAGKLHGGANEEAIKFL